MTIGATGARIMCSDNHTAVHSLLYISHSRIDPSEAQDVVQHIIDIALEHNARLGLTGALLFTGTHFAQVLEGREDVIDRLMHRVIGDQRHDQLLIVDKAPLPKRRFASWSMAYFGPSQFVSCHVTRLLNNSSPQEHRRASTWLTELLQEFSAA